MGVGKKPVLGGKDAVKVAIVQKAPRFLDKEASLTRAETYIAEAASGGLSSSSFQRYGWQAILTGPKAGIRHFSRGSEGASRSATRLSLRQARTQIG